MSQQARRLARQIAENSLGDVLCCRAVAIYLAQCRGINQANVKLDQFGESGFAMFPDVPPQEFMVGLNHSN